MKIAVHDMYARCENCGNPLTGQKPGLCPDCKKQESLYRHRLICTREKQNPENYYSLVDSEDNEDIYGLQFSLLELETGYYSWLHNAILKKGGKYYRYDGYKKCLYCIS